MQSIISSANAWCQNKITRQGMTQDMMKQIQKYNLALDGYLDGHVYSRAMLMETLNDLDLSSDLVECKCKSPMATKFRQGAIAIAGIVIGSIAILVSFGTKRRRKQMLVTNWGRGYQ